MSNIRINHDYFNRNPVKLAQLKFMVTINENISHDSLKDDKKLVDTILYKLEIVPPTIHARVQLIDYLSSSTLKELRSVPMWKRFHCVALALYCARINYYILEPCSNFASSNYTRALWASLTNETPQILLSNMLSNDLQSQGFQAAMSNIEVFIPNVWTKPVTEKIKQKIVQHYRNRYNAKRDHYDGEFLPTIARISKRYASCFKNHPKYKKRFARQIRSVRYLKHQLKIYVTSFREDAPEEVSDSDPEEEVKIEDKSNSRAITSQDKNVRRNETESSSEATPSSEATSSSTEPTSSSSDKTSPETRSSSSEKTSSETTSSTVSESCTPPLRHSSGTLAKQITAHSGYFTSKSDSRSKTPAPAPSARNSQFPRTLTPTKVRQHANSSQTSTPAPSAKPLFPKALRITQVLKFLNSSRTSTPVPSEKSSEEASFPLVSTPVSSRVRHESSRSTTLTSRQEEEDNCDEASKDTDEDEDDGSDKVSGGLSESDDSHNPSEDEGKGGTENMKNRKTSRGRRFRRIISSDSEEDEVPIKKENDEDAKKAIVIKQEKDEDEVVSSSEKSVDVKEEPMESEQIKKEIKEEKDVEGKKKLNKDQLQKGAIIIISDTEEDVIFIKKYNKNKAPPIVINDESEGDDPIDLTSGDLSKDEDLHEHKRETRSMKRRKERKKYEHEKSNKKKKVKQ